MSAAAEDTATHEEAALGAGPIGGCGDTAAGRLYSQPESIGGEGTPTKRGKKNRGPLVRIEPLIVTVREQKIILDSDLARIYGVATSRLNEQVKRNIERFPEDFAFQLTTDEYNLISQNAT